MRALRTALVVLLAAGLAYGQEAALDRLKREAKALKAVPREVQNADQFARQLKVLHLALRDWIESRLPRIAAPMGDLKDLEATLESEVSEALGVPNTSADAVAVRGSVQLEFRWLPDLYDTLFVVAGAGVECGADEAVYMYHFDAHGRTRVFEDHPGDKFQYTDVALELSDPDSEGRRLLVPHYWSVQCESTWMGMAYSAYRLGARSDVAERLLSGSHEFWLGNDGPGFVLKPDELVIQFLDRSVATDVHNRTQIHRYSFSDGVHRLDPVALQPQDFVEEWLTTPWSEMQSRSATETKEWHDPFGIDLILADYDSVAPCLAKPGYWLIGLDITQIGEKQLDEPLETWFLVRDLGDYHYRMESVDDSRPPGCPGAGNASDKHPLLSTSELKALK